MYNPMETQAGVCAKASSHEEPGAGKLHAGICEGDAGQPEDLP